MSRRLPPGIGLDVNKPLIYNPWQQEFLKARRMRYAPCCNRIGNTGADGLFRCPVCATEIVNAKRVYRRLGIFAGRRGGKSVIGAHGAREEMLAPNTLGWVCGPTYKILHDATMPALLKLIPREWCADWDQEHLELTLTNGAQVQFRSLDDPDRGHAGVGLHWAWLDEAAFIASLAWDYLRPALTDFGGVAFFTSSVDGYDWTYDRIEKPALIDKKPGFWAAKFRTIDNPYIATYHPEEIQEARESMPPQIFRQEYEAARENFTGAVYGEWIDETWLGTDDAVREYIPEWPNVGAHRKIVGLDSGADHPFGGVVLVSTERGMVVVADYLERQRAFSSHLAAIRQQFPIDGNLLWCANRNEAQLRLEFNAHGILVAPAESNQAAGIQRVLSWLYTGQLKIAHTCPRTFEQMKKYRYADNLTPDGAKAEKEKVFKKDDELPDCIRYALMTWPSLPRSVEVFGGRDMKTIDPRVRRDIERMQKYESRGTRSDLTPADKEFPLGDFYGNQNDVAGDMFGGEYVG